MPEIAYFDCNKMRVGAGLKPAPTGKTHGRGRGCCTTKPVNK